MLGGLYKYLQDIQFSKVQATIYFKNKLVLFMIIGLMTIWMRQ